MKYVLRRDLWEICDSAGRLFQNLRALLTIAFSPLVFSQSIGKHKRPLSWDFKIHTGRVRNIAGSKDIRKKCFKVIGKILMGLILDMIAPIDCGMMLKNSCYTVPDTEILCNRLHIIEEPEDGRISFAINRDLVTKTLCFVLV